MKLFYDMLNVCKNNELSNYLSFMFLMLIFEEICEYSRKYNNLQVLIKLFLEVQFIGFPPEMLNFRRYKALLIKYFPFYLIKNLSFLEEANPFKEIIEKHKEFKTIFEDVCKPMKIDGLDVGLVNPIDIVESKKLKTILSNDQSNAEQVLDMLRLEIEIWENFIYQISQFDKEEKKNYQCMLVICCHPRGASSFIRSLSYSAS
jgi:hypothetical protein